MKRKRIQRRRFVKGLSIETLETRLVLDADPLTFSMAPSVYSPTTSQEQAIAAKAGNDLAHLWADWTNYETGGGETTLGSFASYSSALAQNKLLEVQNNEVVVNAYAQAGQKFSSFETSLANLGMENLIADGAAGVSGFLPLGGIYNLISTTGLNFAKAAYAGIVNVGATTSQGDAAQYSDALRTTYSVTGAGVKVGVISDSYDTAYQVHPTIATRAANDVATGDLPGGTNPVQVLDDSDPGDRLDEGRAMLQIVHDVAPGASLAFSTAGTSDITMANSILNLKTAGASVIVDDITFLDEPMFQDGIIAQTVDQVVNQGVAYFSAAGNEGGQTYESAFHPGTSVIIDGATQIAHEFNTTTHDILQSVTIPANATFRASFQWDSPSASTGGVGSPNDLNFYLVSGSTYYNMTPPNNVGGDAVEVPYFFNNTGLTAFNILITSRSGAFPSKIKYEDFSIPNSLNQTVTYNEYLSTNVPTLFGHANSTNDIAVDAAAYYATPAFGVSPPVVDGYSSLGGVPILFNTAGTRLGTPIVRQRRT